MMPKLPFTAPPPSMPPLLLSPLIYALGDPDTCAALGIELDTASIPWAPQRQNGIPATSWQASDAVRQTGADGMIYTCRREPRLRWHIVLFRWNLNDGAQFRIAGEPQEFIPQYP